MTTRLGLMTYVAHSAQRPEIFATSVTRSQDLCGLRQIVVRTRMVLAMTGVTGIPSVAVLRWPGFIGRSTYRTRWPVGEG